MHILEMLYYLGMSTKRAYMLGHQKRLPSKVISVGNLTTGGTGKTPCVIALAREAQSRGLKPIILTRGYKGTAKGPVFVSRGEGPVLTVEEAGDEPFLMAAKLPVVPIVKGGDRYASGLYAMEHLAPCGWDVPSTIFILDDGFQHWGLHRDKDILLIDSANPFGIGRLLPLGRLREPLDAMGRADCIVLTRVAADQDASDKAASLLTQLRTYNPGAPVFRAGQGQVSCRTADGGPLPEGWLKGKRVYAFCGLGNPDSFTNTLLSEGAIVSGMRGFRDHYAYAVADTAAVATAAKRVGAEWIVTTEKDIIKLRGGDLSGQLVVVDAGFSTGSEFYDEVLGSRH
jgi:tetraacyldisaccharide 4'-kinase